MLPIAFIKETFFYINLSIKISEFYGKVFCREAYKCEDLPELNRILIVTGKAGSSRLRVLLQLRKKKIVMSV